MMIFLFSLTFSLLKWKQAQAPPLLNTPLVSSDVYGVQQHVAVLLLLGDCVHEGRRMDGQWCCYLLVSVCSGGGGGAVRRQQLQHRRDLFVDVVDAFVETIQLTLHLQLHLVDGALDARRRRLLLLMMMMLLRFSGCWRRRGRDRPTWSA